MTPAPIPGPAITGLRPGRGPVGELVTIVGTRLQGATRVVFNGVEATGVLVSGDRVTAPVPEGARSGPVTVHVAGVVVQAPEPFEVTPATPDPALDVVPFSPAQVRHWPGLANLRSSCFLNASVKLLAAMPEVDPHLRDRAGDAPADAEVRRQLRRAINHVRSGAARPAGAQDPMRELVGALGHHPSLKRHVPSALDGPGGFVTVLVDDLLQMLGLADHFAIRTLERTWGDGAIQETQGRLRLQVCAEPTLNGGYDLGGAGTVAEVLAHVTTGDGVLEDGRRRRISPVRIPRAALLKVDHWAPNLALGFSEEVRIPLYPARGAASPVQVPLRASAAVLNSGGHVWAAVRGTGGWYVQNDAQPSRLAQPGELDGVINADASLAREVALILYRRQDAVSTSGGSRPPAP